MRSSEAFSAKSVASNNPATSRHFVSVLLMSSHLGAHPSHGMFKNDAD